METTAACIITDKSRILVCHPTGAPWKRSWSLPKGIIDNNETAENAVIREIKEETGINLEKDKLISAGIYPYRTLKNMHIFLYNIDTINVSELKCISVFEQKPGIFAPEVDKYAWIVYSKAAEYLNPSQYKLCQEIIQW